MNLPGNLLLRPAMQRDKEEILRVHLSAIREVCSRHYSEVQVAAWTGFLRPQRYEDAINDGNFIVAENDNEIVGFAYLDVEDEELKVLYVDPRAAGFGIGKLLLNEIEEDAINAGIKNLLVYSTINASSFYQKHGYNFECERRYKIGPEIWLESHKLTKPLKSKVSPES